MTASTKPNVIALLCTFALVGIAPSVAQAAPPTQDAYSFSGAFTVAQCDSFAVVCEYRADIEETTFFDNDGNATMSHWFLRSDESCFNSATGFRSSPYKASINEHWDYTTGDLTVTGTGTKVFIPGYGHVFFDAGRGSYELVNGRYQLVSLQGNVTEDATALCEAMDQG